ncbi:MAG: hypothetical protein V3S20_01640 [Dehalococcoidia bacterium]
MSMLTAEQYEEYIQLLRAWVDAEKALGGPAGADAVADQGPDGRASARVREAYAAVQGFRAQHRLGEAAMAVAAEPEAG